MLRYLVVRSAVFSSAIFLSAIAGLGAAAPTAGQSSPKQTSPSTASIDKSTSDPSVAPQVAEAEAAIVKSDWKTAETKLDAWLTARPNDARALFDAGYVADAQNRTDDAAALYRRATEADPKSFEAHLSLGLLLARQGKLTDARPELEAATILDPGEAGLVLKARAWRALAEIDKPDPDHPGDPTQASSELLEALKLTPETSADTLLAASLAESAANLKPPRLHTADCWQKILDRRLPTPV
jgi:tetratricopeptide (TPR) repeat protein